MSGYGTCHRCGRPVLWARSRKGRLVPLDIDSDQLRGQWRVEVKLEDKGVRYVAYHRDSRMPEDAILFVCHYETCERKPGPVRRIDPKTGAVRESE